MEAIKVVKLYKLLKTGRRIAVRRVQDETGLSRSSVYRCCKSLAKIIPTKIRNGIIIPEHDRAETL